MEDSMFDAFFNDPKSPHYVPPKCEQDGNWEFDKTFNK